MLSRPATWRIAISLTIAVFIAGVVLIQSGGVSHAGKSPLLPPSISASDAVTFPTGGDVDADGKADPGDILQYTVTITNGGTDATGVSLTSTLQNITTLVAGSLSVSPIASGETYTSVGNMTLTSSAIAATCAINPLRSLTCNDVLNGGTISGFGATQGTANGTVVNGTNTVATGTGGTVVLNTDGTFVYNPAAGFEGADSFWYTLSNTGGTDNAQVTINVGGASGMVWFINSTAGAGTGRQASPFNTLSAFNGVNNGTGNNPAAGDTIFLFEGAYTGPVTLLNTQKLIGQDATASVPTLGGPAAQLGNAYPATNPTGTTVAITSASTAITLASGNTLAGFSVGNSTTAITGGTVGTVNVREVAINTNGQALIITTSSTVVNNATFTGFASVTSTGGTNGVSLTGVDGTLALGSGDLSGQTGAAFNASGGNATITYSGTIRNSGGRQVNIVNKTGGTVTFSGAVSGTGTGIFLDNNDQSSVATIAFTGGVALNTGANTAFTATNGGTVNAPQNNTTIINTLATTTGTALNVANTTIGASGLTFQSIAAGTAASGPVSGIILNNTGTSGGLSVTGTGTAASGGTIQKTSGDGVSLTTTEKLSLKFMSIQNNLGDGIGGAGVNGFQLDNCSITGNGNDAATDESGINVTQLTGTVAAGARPTSITNTTISNNNEFEFQITNSSGTLADLQMSGNTISSNGLPINGNATSPHGSLVNFLGQGTSTMTLTVTSGNFTGNWNPTTPPTTIVGDGIFCNSGGTAMTCNISGATFTNDNVGIDVSTDPVNTTFSFNLSSNTITGTRSTAINSFHNGNAPFARTINGKILNNLIGSATLNSGSVVGRGVDISNEGSVPLKIQITGNTIREMQNFEAIGVNIGLSGLATGGGLNELTITNNTIRDIRGSRGLIVQDNQDTTGGGPFPTVCTNISGNTFTGVIAGQAGNGQFMRLRRLNGTFRVTQATPTAAAVAGELDDANGFNDPTKIGLSGTITFSQAPCTAPPFAPEIEAENTNRLFENTLSFLNTDYQLRSGSILTKPSLFDVSAERQSSERSEVACIASAKRISETPETTATADASAAAELVGTSYLDSASGVLASVAEVFDKFRSSIEPTVYAQKETPPKDNTPNATQSGETVTTTPAFTLPAGKTVTVKYQAKVDNGPYAAGVNNIDNQATISGSNFANVTTNTASKALDAAPDLSITTSDGAVTTQPGGVVTYTLTYKNGNAVNGQDATGVTISNTVPPNTTFNLASSGTGWSCVDGAIAGTVCTNLVGSVTANNTTATKNFAVKVLDALPAAAIQISNTATIAEVPANTNGTDLNPADNTGNDTTNIIGNWLGGTSTDWNLAANWSNGVIPPSGNNISVPTSGNQPTLVSADVTVGNLTLGGQGVTINSGRILNTTGVISLGANSVNGAGTLSMGATSTITRTTGQVNSILNKAFAGPGTFTYPVGTTTALAGFSPVDVNVTAGNGSLSVKANTGTAPATTPPLVTANTLQRYWDLNGSGITTDVTWHYLQGDVMGTEANYRIIRIVSGGTAISVPNGSPCPGTGSPCVDTTANTIFAKGLTSFSLWTAGANVVTAAKVAISGRVVRPDGLMAVRSLVSITDDHGNVRYAKTNPFGYFRFQDVETGQGYVINVIDKRFEFTPQFVSVTDNMGDLVLTLQPRP